MTFDTKIAIIVRDDLAVWQKLNVTAFTISGIAGTQNLMGEAYEDADEQKYLPMIIQPIMIYEAPADKLRNAYNRAISREIDFSIYTEDLFTTPNDIENRAAIKAVKSEDLNLVGLAMRAERKIIDKITKGISLHS